MGKQISLYLPAAKLSGLPLKHFLWVGVRARIVEKMDFRSIGRWQGSYIPLTIWIDFFFSKTGERWSIENILLGL